MEMIMYLESIPPDLLFSNRLLADIITPKINYIGDSEVQAKFKVGDKVRCVRRSIAGGVHVGNVYTIKNPRSHTSRCYDDVVAFHVTLEEVESTPSELMFELVEPNPVLTPEEVFEHLRKGTKLQWAHKESVKWIDHTGVLRRITVNELLDYDWRIKPEPEVIELNGKRYKLIEE